MTNYTCIGIGTTDENGIAHITHDCEGNPLSEPGYHGSGAGETLIIASLDKPVSVESILSNILNITDEDRYKLTLTGDKSIIQTGEVATLSATLTNNNIAVVNKTVNFLKKEEVFRDAGVTGDSSAEYWAWNSSYVSQSVGSTGTTVTNSDNSDRVYTLRKATSGSQYEVFSRFCSFEFDLISVTGNVQIQQRIGTTQKGYNLTETGHYKIINDDEYINIYCNDVLKDRLENTMTGLHQIRFGLFGISSFTYKNFKVLDDEIFDTATTDVNGVATVSYTGQGTGALNIKSECMNLIETYSITDVIFKDIGTDVDYASWTSSSNMDIDRSSGAYTQLTPQGTNSTMYNTIISGMSCFEFDFSILTSSFSTGVWSFRQGSTNKGAISPSNLDVSDNDWHHVKFVIDGTEIHINVDGEDKTSRTLSDTTINRFYIILNNTKHTLLDYKNFLIY